MKEVYLFTNSLGEVGDSGLIDFFICLCCQYWEPLRSSPSFDGSVDFVSTNTIFLL